MTIAAIIISILSSIILLLMFFILGAMAKKIKVLNENVLKLAEVGKLQVKLFDDIYKRLP